ncbi:MAG: type 1 glutamine amidotransferase domain-containing protein [Atopobiaceae bacterium]|nr:type 1 glutamine amidotransferase domain-containing protein [Atopobiaceae bacterium]
MVLPTLMSCRYIHPRPCLIEAKRIVELPLSETTERCGRDYEGMWNMKVLIVETNVARYQGTDELTGLWLGEAAEFIDEMDQAEIDVDFVSPNGGFVPLDPRSMKYVDESILRIYESPDFIKRGLSGTLRPEQINPQNYEAIYYAGGHGVMWDFPDNKSLQKIALQIYTQGGYVASVCHGVAGLMNIKKENGNYLIKDKKITGFTAFEEILAGKAKIVPFFNQKQAESRGANWRQKRFYRDFAIRDGRVITGQNPFSVRSVAKLLIEVLT